MARLVWCETGQHYWQPDRRQGGVPSSCPRHTAHRRDDTIELWCEAGQHAWRRPRAIGRPPTSCPEHSNQRVPAARAARTRWIGDLKTCFLLEEGWAFRLHVNRFQLKGRAGWRMPLSLAESLGLSDGETRSLKPMNPELIQEISLTRRSGALIGGPIDVPLHRVGAVEGDYAFFCIRGDRYDFVLRARSELREADALGTLLWSCGLDQRDETLRHSPWRHLARSLGGESRGREEIRRRLHARRDDELLSLLEAVEAEGGVRLPGWIEGWAYRAAPLPHEQLLVLEGGEHGVRVAVGVVDTSGQPPPGLIPSDGGVLWLDQPAGFEYEEVEALLNAPPDGLVPAARRSEWSRWMRAEHVARRAALVGSDWSVKPNGQGWSTSGDAHDRLVEALESLEDPRHGDAAVPAAPIRQTYPRSAVAFQRAVEAAIRKRLALIRADATRGFVAAYGSGREVVGASLMDVLAAG
jgi:hypothetical protein